MTICGLGHGQFFGTRRRQAEIAGFAVADMDPDPRVDVQRHTHVMGHFIFLLSGAYLTTARGAPSVCTRSTLIYNPPGTTHRDRFQRQAGSFTGRFLSISVSADQHAMATEVLRLPEMPLCLDDPQGAILSSRAIRECSAWENATPLLLESLCLELLAVASNAAPEHGRGAPGWLARAREILHSEEPGALSIGTVAERCGVHPVHLARVFRRVVGCSPAHYLRRLRLERAAAALRSRRTPIAMIACAAGFADQSHLNKAFRCAYGLTPLEYRRLFCAEPHFGPYDVAQVQDRSAPHS
jgi:AraC family transcriptional regulator